ncbi:MAG: hypothetical protein DRQ89_14920 [Epsilonproteobacteria bacterium]|nr:MAG: hypothetical protein DRQ89_14920 [Campylobacterota bacterium]
MIEKRNRENIILRKLIATGAIMAQKLDGQGTSEAQALAAAWQDLLEKSRQQNLLGATNAGQDREA